MWVGAVPYRRHQYDIHRIRQSVFVCEQHVPLAFETDQLDPHCQHVLAYWNGWAVATGRLTPEGRIGRVSVTQPLRRRGVGRQVMETLLAVAKAEGHRQVVLSAQCHAIPFYEKLGFYAQGLVYQSVGIDHITMYKDL
ncbi:MAG: GNAT family N-acetyltransferase [Cyanobacteria bacterium]|nr:GNAT family N-acetyltransferase [Cyanobacteriota bacterium]MEB3269908.1 GNAT family N-acetyltransferase [Leptolyngbya sp.]